MDALVAHYHEIGLKGRNREHFEAMFTRNLKRALRGMGYKRLRRGFGRVVVDLDEGADWAAAAERVARVFGTAYVGAGRRVQPDLDEIGKATLEALETEPFESFAIRARRTYSSFELTSNEINRRIGQLVKDTTNARVDLTNPDATVWIELFGGAGIVYRRRLKGVGGLPVGVSGKMIALMSGGIDSPVAVWRMAKRGADVELAHFHGQPFTDPSSVRQALELAEVLARYQLRVLVHLIPLGDAQREIVTHAPASLRVVLYRRVMLRIAAALAHERGAQALVTGDSLGQVASQTVENIRTVGAAVPEIEVFRPLVGMDKQEIIDLASTIGTYEISTRKYQDCCVLFEPRSPATKATADIASHAEAELDMDALVGKALAGLETRVVELEAG